MLYLSCTTLVVCYVITVNCDISIQCCTNSNDLFIKIILYNKFYNSLMKLIIVLES